MESRYDPKEWAERTIGGRRILNIGYRLISTDLRGWRLLKTVPIETSRGEGEFAYLWVRSNDPGPFLVRVSTAELADWRAAHARLLEDLRSSMRPDIPPGTGELSALGDVSYVGRDPETDVPASISFTRGNVMVTVRSVGDQAIAVGDIALRIDRALGQRPPRRQVARGRTEARAIEVSEPQSRASYALVKSLTRVAPRGGWLKLIAPDGELRRDRDAVLYVAASPGAKTIHTFLRR